MSPLIPLKKILGGIGGFFGFHRDDPKRPPHHQHANLPREDERGHDEGHKPVREPSDAACNGPVISQCYGEDGGVQGLLWYAEKLQVDEDGDYANEFLSEVVTGRTGSEGSENLFSFQIKENVRKPKITSGVNTCEGNVFLVGSGRQVEGKRTRRKR